MFSSLTVFGIHWLCLFIKMRVWVFFPPLFCHTCHRASGKPCIQLSQGLTGKCEESSAPPPSVSVHQAANSDYHTVCYGPVRPVLCYLDCPAVKCLRPGCLHVRQWICSLQHRGAAAVLWQATEQCVISEALHSTRVSATFDASLSHGLSTLMHLNDLF